jgi:hypothetical protein
MSVPYHFDYLNESFYYSTLSPVNCTFLNVISLYLLILLIASFNLNAILLYMFWNFKPLHKSNNYYMIAITVYNLFGSVFELPFVIQSCLTCKYKSKFLHISIYSKTHIKKKIFIHFQRWEFGRSGCVLTGFVMYFIGCTSCYLLSVLSVEK